MAQEDFAIVIGISRYPNLNKDLQGPVDDATRFASWLVGPAEVPRDQVEIVTSKNPPEPGNKPIVQDINDAFRTIFRKAKQKNARRLYLYFAGHGCAQEFQHITLLMADASLDELNLSVDAKSYQEGLARRGLFREQIMFYDCCRNFDRRAVGMPPPWSKEDPDSAAANVAQFVLYGAGFTQYANELVFDYEYPRRGLFTEKLLEGLSGGAAWPENGQWVVKAFKLVPYLQRSLDEVTMRENVRQDLHWNAVGIPRDLDLVTVATPRTWHVMVRVARSPVGAQVVVEDDTLKRFDAGPIVGNHAEFELPPGTFVFRVEPGGSGKVSDIGPGQANIIDIT